MIRRRDCGLTAVELVVVITVIGIAAAVTVPALLRTGRNDLLARCEANLKALREAEIAYRATGAAAPSERGGAYWERIAAAAKLKLDVLVCPLGHGRYRGPGVDPATLPSHFPICADAPGSHGPGEGGNVLLKTGEVRAIRERDSLWQFAAERLAP